MVFTAIVPAEMVHRAVAESQKTADLVDRFLSACVVPLSNEYADLGGWELCAPSLELHRVPAHCDELGIVTQRGFCIGVGHPVN
jgi:hypothetical protein